MEFVFEILFQFFGELLLQLLFEALSEVGLHGVKDTLRKPRNLVLSTIGFAVWGAVAGAVSLLIFPESPIRNPDLRLVNLLVTPVLAGLAMVALGKLRLARGQDTVMLDRFVYAYVFALGFAVLRFAFVG